MNDIYMQTVFFSKNILTREEAELSIKQSENLVNEMLEKDQGVIARNRMNIMIKDFKKWGYDDLIPQLSLLLGEIQNYIRTNPSAGIEPNRKPKGDGHPLPPFENGGRRLMIKPFRRTYFPEEIFDYPQLEELLIVGDPNFNRGFPLRIPDKFDKLPNLRKLILNYMDLGPLPESISRLTRLETLSLHHGVIREIPAWIGNLRSLKELDLTSQGFTSLPNSIRNLHSLEKFFHNLKNSRFRTFNKNRLKDFEEIQRIYGGGNTSRSTTSRSTTSYSTTSSYSQNPTKICKWIVIIVLVILAIAGA